jgi:hypothetical protein
MGDDMTNEELEARVARLEARVQELEDERAVRELLARYGFNADCLRDEAFVDLFTDDGVVDLVVGAGATTVLRYEGKAELEQFISNPQGRNRPDVAGHVLHMQGNNVVSHYKGDEAVVNSYSVVVHAKDAQLSVISAGNNEWRMRKVDGKWLFKERRRRELGGPDYTTNVDATPT